MKNQIIRILLLVCLVSLTNTLFPYRVTKTQNTSSAITLTLTYTGQEEYYRKPTSPIVKELLFTFHSYTFTDFSFKIYDPKNPRFEVPQEGYFPIEPISNFSFPISLSSVRFEYT